MLLLTIESDPTSYLNHYKRATAYLSLGRHAAALDDFDAILKLNPDFAQAHLQKAKILAKEGEFELAKAELKAYHRTKGDAESKDLAKAVDHAISEYSAGVKASKQHKWQDCVGHVTAAIKVGSNAAALRQLRAQCETELGNSEAAYADLSRLAMLRPASESLRLRLASIAFFFLEPGVATAEIKKCLHFDPDSKKCKAAHKRIRAFEKDLTKAREFVEGGTHTGPRRAINILRGEDGLIARFEAQLAEAIESDSIPAQFDAKHKSTTRIQLYSLACKATVDANDFTSKGGAAWCEEVLTLAPDDESGLVYRGEKLMKAEKWDEAVAAFQRAFEKSGRQSHDIMQRMQKAERLLKVAKQKDYYKVLGVGRDADERTIKKAFRKAAKANHPDVGGSEEKMQQINEAYEVLSDPDLKARYDNGDDPNDPTGGQGGNPFAHHQGGGMPFFFQQGAGGGGFPGGGFPGGGGGFPGGGGQKFQFNWG